MATSDVLGPEIRRGVSLRPYATLRAGGSAERLAIARTADELAHLAVQAQSEGIEMTTLGMGSNILPSDAGVPGLVVINSANELRVSADGLIEADCGASFQDLCIRSAQFGLSGLEFAVGIPGTIGGALVSNAGAYRSNVSEFLTEIEVVSGGVRQWVPPSFMEFAYRDSLLRRSDPPAVVLLRIRMQVPPGERLSIWNEARDYQRQRIGKQPAPASAGSFFKNVYSSELANRLPTLPERMREAGVVPAGYLIEAAGLKGKRHQGAMMGARHANFMLNVGGASASAIRSLATHVQAVVQEQFGVALEEEVLYLGDWGAFVADSVA